MRRHDFYLRLVAALLALALVSGLSFALAGPARAETPARWSGLSIGAHGGGDLTHTEATAFGVGIDGLGGRGALAGGQIGLDWHLPGTQVVIGAGADASWSTAKFTVSPGLLEAKLEQSWVVYGRLGLALGAVMPYVLGGYTQAEASASLSGSDYSKTLTGWIGGAGLQYAVSEHVSLGAEYRFTRFDSVDVGGIAILDTDRHSLRALVNWRLDLLQ
jgi:outer membrane immunogenic protein